MRISCDRRSVGHQAISGVKIAGAMLATFATLALIVVAYFQITKFDSGLHVLAGSLLMVAIVVGLSTAVQYWHRWFYFLPGFVAVRSGWWVLLGWFSPRGYILIGFSLLMAIMPFLSYRFAKITRISAIHRFILLSTLACFLGSGAAVLSAEPKISALALAGLGDLILLLGLAVTREPYRRRKTKRTETGAAVPTSSH